MSSFQHEEVVHSDSGSVPVRSWIGQAALVCAIVILPIWVMTPFGFDKFGEIKFALVMLIAATGAAAFLWWSVVVGGFKVESGPAVWLVGLLVVQGLFAALGSVDPVRGVVGSPVRYDGYLMLLANAAIFLLGYRISTGRRERAADLLARLTVVTAVPVWLYAVVQALHLDPIQWEAGRIPQGRVFSTLGNPIFLGAFSIMAVIVALTLGASDRSFRRVLWSAAAGLGTTIVVFTAARASWIALAGGLVLLVALASRFGTMRSLAVTLIIASTVSSGVAGVVLSQTESAHSAVLSSSVATIVEPEAARNAGRRAIWAISIRMISDHPALGIGLDEMGQRFDTYRTQAFDLAEGPSRVADKPHSSLLEWGVETGVPGLVLFVGLVAVVLISAGLRLSRGQPFAASASESGIWLAALVYFAQSLVTVTAIGVDGVWWLLLGVLAAPRAGGARYVGDVHIHARHSSVFRASLSRENHLPSVRSRARRYAEHGFTLIELLVVIIIIAILGAIAVPTYLGARASAQNAAAYTLVRNALTVVESARIDSGTYLGIGASDLQAIEPNIDWNLATADLVTAVPPAITTNVTAQARTTAIDFYPESPTKFDIACISDSGDRFGIQVETTGSAKADYVKVKVVDGSGSLGW